jgi:hypothetical protein
MKTEYRIYALIDPRDNAIRYVGSTRHRLSYRLGCHIHKSRLIPETPLAVWINQLISKGLNPQIVKLALSETRQTEKAGHAGALYIFRLVFALAIVLDFQR